MRYIALFFVLQKRKLGSVRLKSCPWSGAKIQTLVVWLSGSPLAGPALAWCFWGMIFSADVPCCQLYIFILVLGRASHAFSSCPKRLTTKCAWIEGCPFCFVGNTCGQRNADFLKKKKEGCALMCTIKTTAKTLDILELKAFVANVNKYLPQPWKEISCRHYLDCLVLSTEPCDRRVCNEWFSDC